MLTDEHTQPLTPTPAAPAPRRTWLIVATTISLLVAIVASGVAVLALRHSEDALRRLDDAEQQATTAYDQAIVALNAVSDAKAEETDNFLWLEENTVTPSDLEAEVGDVYDSITLVHDRIDGRVDYVIECTNRNLDELVESGHEGRGGNYEIC